VSTEFDADVLVVGCGPVGVMAALRCAQRGLDVIAVDRSTDIYPLPRAIGMDDEIQALVERAGFIDEFRTYSSPMPGGEFTDGDGNRVVGIELPDGTVGALGHPPIVTFNQPALEANLRRDAVAAGVDMRLGLDAFAVADIEVQGRRGVRVDLSDNDRDTSLTGRWLVAADGAKSTIRSLRGLEMIDQGFDQTWLVVDTELLDPDLPLPRIARQQCGADRVCTLVPGPGAHRRWEFQLRPDEQRDEVLAPGAIADFLAPWGTMDQLQVTRAAVYRFHAVVAERFRDGRVFLVGDAAHQMPPFNGQGMCSGMRDAENLSWKLAAVASGLADDLLLDTYDEERRPHAAEQVAHSVDSGLLMQAIAHDGEAALESGYGQRPFPQLAGTMFVGGHVRVGSVLPVLRADVTVPDEGWRLIQVGDPCDVPAFWSDLEASVVQVPDGAFPGLAGEGETVIVRPDRYIAAVTSDLAESTEEIASAFHPAKQAR
jgi:3-(3-hydroxy-phenyl)propionate hydroxylase